MESPGKSIKTALSQYADPVVLRSVAANYLHAAVRHVEKGCEKHAKFVAQFSLNRHLHPY